MKRYGKIIDGELVIKPLNQIFINTEKRTVFNPSEEIVIEEGWEEYVEDIVHTPTEEELLAQAQEGMLNQIRSYDASEAVNECYIIYDGIELSYWADKGTRNDLKAAVEDCIAVGRTSYRLDLRELGISLQLPCEQLLQMLSALEVYAIDCYNKTTDHIYAVKAMTNHLEVVGYDYKSGYPEKLRFNINK
jgi:hypothetical protein